MKKLLKHIPADVKQAIVDSMFAADSSHEPAGVVGHWLNDIKEALVKADDRILVPAPPLALRDTRISYSGPAGVRVVCDSGGSKSVAMWLIDVRIQAFGENDNE